MELYDFVKLIRSKKKTIFSIVFTTIVLVMAVNFVLPKKYDSELQVLIIQNNLNNTDPYLISKSSEHLGNILTKVVYTGSFYNRVMESGFGIDRDYFGKSYKDQLKKWGKTVQVKNIEDTGIMHIIASHKDRSQAELIVESIGYILKTSHQEYHGSGDNVEIKIINKAITSNFPSDPNIILNTIAGLIFSILFSFIYIYLFPDVKYDLTILPKRKKKISRKNKLYLSEDDLMDIIKEKREDETKNKTRDNEQDNRFFNKNEIYQENNIEKKEDNNFGGYKENRDEDDLDIDYEEIKQKGNINNIL